MTDLLEPRPAPEAAPRPPLPNRTYISTWEIAPKHDRLRALHIEVRGRFFTDVYEGHTTEHWFRYVLPDGRQASSAAWEGLERVMGHYEDNIAAELERMLAILP